MRSRHEIDSRMEEEIFKLQDLVRIDEARVRLERRRGQMPPYRVSVHLVTPGPDIRVETSEHTIAAAMIKAGKELRRCVAEKAVRRASRQRSKLQNPSSFRHPLRGGASVRR
jgi:ribosome-associated translation inhibitor RaiA